MIDGSPRQNARERVTHGSALIIFFVCAMFAVHGMASIFHWYWTFPWIDILSHVAGGGLVAAIALYISRGWGYHPSWKTILGIVFTVGVLWEIVEPPLVEWGVIGGPLILTVTDILGDIISDLAGGALTLLLDRFLNGSSAELHSK